MYRLPGVDVPSALNTAMLVDPNLIGSSPGGGPPGSTDGRPGTAPKSTPGNRSERRSSFCISGSTPLAMSVDRKSTRLNSSHGYISYAVVCLKKKIRRDGL